MLGPDDVCPECGGYGCDCLEPGVCEGCLEPFEWCSCRDDCDEDEWLEQSAEMIERMRQEE